MRRAKPFGMPALTGMGLVAGYLVPALAGANVVNKELISPFRRRMAPRLHGIGRPGHVALTFDDGPDPDATPAILYALEKHDWKATFFMLGSKVERYPSLAAEVARQGHEVSLHGYVHRSHLLRDPFAILADLRRGQEVLSGVCGSPARWFRPPHGLISSGTIVAAKIEDVRLILWTALGRDWLPTATGQSVVAEVNKGLVSGGTVLLHECADTWRPLTRALAMLADDFAKKGLSAGTLSGHGTY